MEKEPIIGRRRFPDSDSAEVEADVETEEAAISKGSEKSRKLILVEAAGLKKLGAQPGLFKYLAELIGRRGFILADARSKAFRTTRNYRFWKFWIIAGPLLDALMYGALFGLLLKTSRGVDNFVGFVILGITFFSVMVKMLSAGSGLLEANKNVMKAFSFPRASIVLSQILRYVYDTIPAIVVAVIAAIAFQWDKGLSWTILLTVPIFILMCLFGGGLMFIAARATFFLADIRAIIDIFSRAWMFGSGIFYDISRFAENPTVYSIMTFNPAYQFIHAAREVVMNHSTLTMHTWLVLSAWGFGTFCVGLIFFWGAEARYARSN